MADNVRKVIPYQPFEFDSIEGWLDDLARQGLALVRIHTWWAEFQRTEPNHQVRYRVKLFDKNVGRTPDAEMREIYESSGWYYVDTFRDFIYIFRTEDVQATELNADPEALKAALQKVLRQKIWRMLVPVLWIIAYMVWDYMFGRMAIRLAERLDEEIVMIFSFCLIWLFQLLSEVRSVLHLKRKLKSDDLFSHRAEPYRRAMVRDVGDIVILFIILFLPLLAHFGMIGMISALDEVVDVEVHQGTLAFPLLEEFSPEEWQAYTDGAAQNPSRVRYIDEGWLQQNPLAPTALHVMQTGTDTAEQCGDGVRYDVTYYDVQSLRFAKRLTADYVANYCEAPYCKNQPQEEESCAPNLDFVRFCRIEWDTGAEQRLVLRKDRRVLYVSYRGESDLRDCLTLFASYLARE